MNHMTIACLIKSRFHPTCKANSFRQNTESLMHLSAHDLLQLLDFGTEPTLNYESFTLYNGV